MMLVVRATAPNIPVLPMPINGHGALPMEKSERTPQEAAHAQAEVKLRRRLHALRRITLQAWEMGDSGRYVSNGDEDLDTFGFPRFFVPCDKNGKPRPSSSSPFGQEDPRP